MISRSTLIGALVVVELAIVGMAAKAVAGRAAAGPFGMSGFHAAFAEHAPTVDRTFVTGVRPHVLIDVHDIHVVVDTANVPSVHVVETLRRSGYISGDVVPLTAQQTLDGVRVRTSGDSDVVTFGSFHRDVHVTVPPDASVEITGAERIDASGLRTKLVAHIAEGPIYVKDHRGDLDLSCAEGRIVLTDVQAADIAANTRDGRLLFKRVGADRLNASTSDGVIEAIDLRAVDGVLTTRDGHVVVSFTGESDATVSVRTGDGELHVAGFDTTNNTETSSMVHVGTGRGHFEISTSDGPITITPGAKV